MTGYSCTGATVVVDILQNYTAGGAVSSLYQVRFDPGCTFRRTYTAEDINPQIPWLDALFIGVPMTTADVITLEGELTYGHNSRDALTDLELFVTYFKKPGSGTPAHPVQVSVGTLSWKGACRMMDYTVPTGGGPIKYTMQFGIIQ